jgi:hypothetical protein
MGQPCEFQVNGELSLDELAKTARQRNAWSGGGYIGQPFPALVKSATTGRTLVFYCANPS